MRLRLLRLTPNTLVCRIVSGEAQYRGREVVIPRIAFMQALGTNNPARWKRVQCFPVRLAFALSLKAQAQTLGCVAIDLHRDFAHGHLYTGVSRTGAWLRMRCAVPHHGVTNNVVFKEALIGAGEGTAALEAGGDGSAVAPAQSEEADADEAFVQAMLSQDAFGLDDDESDADSQH